MNFPNFQNTIRVLLSAVWLSGLSISGCALADSTMHHVNIEAMKFSPETLEVTAGERVVWENNDMFPHNVSSSGGKLHSPDIDAKKTWEFIPLKKGTYVYVCSLHPTMKATLIVK